MIHAGAAAGVYELKTMAFESVNSMIRAGKLLFLLLHLSGVAKLYHFSCLQAQL